MNPALRSLRPILFWSALALLVLPRVALAAPTLEATPAEIRFGCTLAGEDSVRFVTFRNTGTVSVTILDFSITSGPFLAPPQTNVLLDPGQSFVGEVHFVPVATPATPTALLVVRTADGDLNVPISGEAGSEPIVGTTTTFIDFGSVTVGDSLRRCFEIENGSCRAVEIQSIRIRQGRAQFRISQGLAPGTLLRQGEKLTLCATFAPDDMLTFDDVLEITTTTGFVRSVNLEGTGVRSELVAVPALLDFGGVGVSVTSTELRVAVANAGNATADIASPPTLGGPHAADFQVISPALPVTVSRNDSAVFRVLFTPTALGARSAFLRIDNTTGTAPVIELRGVGLATDVEVTPDSIDLGAVRVGSQRVLYDTVRIINLSRRTVRLASTVLGGADPTAFAIYGFVVAPIPAGDTFRIDVAFVPPSAREFHARLEATLDDGSVHYVGLHGIGYLEEPPRTRLAWLDTSSTRVGERTTLHARLEPPLVVNDSATRLRMWIHLDPRSLFPVGITTAAGGAGATLNNHADGRAELVVDAPRVFSGSDVLTLELEGLAEGFAMNPVAVDSVTIEPYRGQVIAAPGLVRLEGCEIGAAPTFTRLLAIRGEGPAVRVSYLAPEGSRLRLWNVRGVLDLDLPLTAAIDRAGDVCVETGGLPSGLYVVQLRSASNSEESTIVVRH